MYLGVRNRDRQPLCRGIVLYILPREGARKMNPARGTELPRGNWGFRLPPDPPATTSQPHCSGQGTLCTHRRGCASQGGTSPCPSCPLPQERLREAPGKLVFHLYGLGSGPGKGSGWFPGVVAALLGLGFKGGRGRNREDREGETSKTLSGFNFQPHQSSLFGKIGGNPGRALSSATLGEKWEWGRAGNGSGEAPRGRAASLCSVLYGSSHSAAEHRNRCHPTYF